MQPIRFSMLKAWARSPMHGRLALSGNEQEETYAMERGTAVHALLFKTREVMFYPGVRRGREWDAFSAAHPHVHVLTEKEFVKAVAMAAAVKANKRAMELLTGPGIVNEQTIIAKIAGRDCRATADARGPEGPVELKTSGDVSPVKFFWHLKRMGYHGQLAWQDRVAAAANVPGGEGRFVVAVEDKPPHVVQVYRLSDALCDEGDRLCALWFEGLINCERSDAWPGYGPDEMVLEAPYQDDGLDWGDDEAAA